ncbi:hypothetical protein ACJX0J_017182, partial [Zea mays]
NTLHMSKTEMIAVHAMIVFSCFDGKEHTIFWEAYAKNVFDVSIQNQKMLAVTSLLMLQIILFRETQYRAHLFLTMIYQH